MGETASGGGRSGVVGQAAEAARTARTAGGVLGQGRGFRFASSRVAGNSVDASCKPPVKRGDSVGSSPSHLSFLGRCGLKAVHTPCDLLRHH